MVIIFLHPKPGYTLCTTTNTITDNHPVNYIVRDTLTVAEKGSKYIIPMWISSTDRDVATSISIPIDLLDIPMYIVFSDRIINLSNILK